MSLSITKRYLNQQIGQDLKKKMVFVGGPRQVGKTTLAKYVLSHHLKKEDDISKAYLNWDFSKDKEMILAHELPITPIWIFDEIHKYKDWRNYLKGLYDQFGKTRQILVTGSARLDYYRRGGDSLQGRYHYLRLNPLSVAELAISTEDELGQLFQLGGFPEPFFSGSGVEAKRWSREYRGRLIQEDLLSLENIKDVNTLERLMLRLPALVGSPLSLNSLREDLQVAHKTIQHWLEILERLYAVFRLPPFGSPLLRAVKKEQKHYHYDWTLIADQGARFENMIALHLLKWVQFEEDTKARDLSLRYFRDVDGREVDFIVTEENKPILAVECKLSDGDIGQGLKYFKTRFPDCEALQISYQGKKDYLSKDGIRVCNCLNFLKGLI